MYYSIFRFEWFLLSSFQNSFLIVYSWYQCSPVISTFWKMSILIMGKILVNTILVSAIICSSFDVQDVKEVKYICVTCCLEGKAGADCSKHPLDEETTPAHNFNNNNNILSWQHHWYSVNVFLTLSRMARDHYDYLSFPWIQLMLWLSSRWNRFIYVVQGRTLRKRERERVKANCPEKNI